MKPNKKTSNPNEPLAFPVIEPVEQPAADGGKSLYLQARAEWNERYGDHIAREHRWMTLSFILAGALVIAVGYIGYIGSQSKFIPYVVEVDKLGNSVGITMADAAPRPDERIIKAQLAHWIVAVRSVYRDAGANSVNIKYAYAMLHKGTGPFIKLNEYLSSHDPFTRGEKENVNITIQSVLSVTKDTYQVQWNEDTYASTGELVTSKEHEANITIEPHSSAAQGSENSKNLFINPEQIYISDFNWSQRFGGKS
jgi:type IV secretion system protein VirB5